MIFKKLLSIIFIVAVLFSVVASAEAADRSRFSSAERAEMELESNRLGMTLDEFIDTYATNHVDQQMNVNIVGFIAIGVILSSIVLAWYFWERIKKKKTFEKETKYDVYDDIRKHAVRELYNGIVRFYKKNHRLPSDSEFRDVEYSLTQTIKSDPMEGDIVPGGKNRTFGYYYSNKKLGSASSENSTYFKVWAYLQDGKIYGFSSKSN